ncbi:signal transducer and activator of transcription 1-alpha/beta-like isoform X2 [Mugil cephalus]|uniref:signal transducer and activator of transcription 1-alpha/beta-like isoform X2 n=1 Tax=Mugil cephalus TaxID=48193 RepID=UPI001FB85E7D|nr:signal transducer and activator of transcription 1-alpha/beta-like isoform X2 [Mugil cephalus]
MAQWQDLLRLDSSLQSRVRQLYGETTFPRDIRHFLCFWIESQDWDSAAVNEAQANTYFSSFLLHLDEQWKRSVEENNILQAPDYLRMKNYLKENFENNPLNLAIRLSWCLKEEKKILDSISQEQGCMGQSMEQHWTELHNKVSKLKQQASEIKKEIKMLENLNEKLDFILKTWQSKVEQHNGLAQSQRFVEMECYKLTDIILQKRQIVPDRVVSILKCAEQIVTTLTDVELPAWKHKQQMSCLGRPVDTSLDHLQQWFTTVAEVLLEIHKQLQKLQEQDNKYSSCYGVSLAASLAEMQTFGQSLLAKLLTNALVVEKQPVMQSLPQRPLIIKTGVQFKVTVRFLANIPDFKCMLKVKPVFDKDVEETKTGSGFRLFDFNRSDSKVLDVDTPDRGLTAEFDHMSITEKRSRTKGLCESRLIVTEELHIIKFVTELHSAGQTFSIETSSLPVIVVSSSNQVPSAWASIIWYNMLCQSSSMNLSLFVSPPPLPWTQLSQALSWQFLSVGQRGLDDDQLSMLRDKLVGDDPDDLVHWSNFSKNECAWIWIDGILDLIKKYLVDLWRDGSIMGFVSRGRARLLLQTTKTGTFLLRFSESNKDGAITFSWVDRDANGEPHVHSVEPYIKTELKTISLPDILYRYSLTTQRKTRNPLIYLYPDIHKDVAFKRYCKITEESSHQSGNGNPTPPPSPPAVLLEDDDMDMDTYNDPTELLKELGFDVFWPSGNPLLYSPLPVSSFEEPPSPHPPIL